MSSQWPLLPLGEVLSHRNEFIEINDLEPYKRCRVRLHAQGIVLRDQVSGAEIKTKRQQVCRAGEFLVAEIDAKLGGYGMVPTELDGSIVSSHYFLFDVNEQKLDRSFLGYFVRTPAFFEQVAAQGSTNYAAIRPGHVLEYTLPLPPLPEQRRLVERLDALAAKIDEVKRLRIATDQQSSIFLGQFVKQIFEKGRASGWKKYLMGDILTDATYGTSEKTSDDQTGVPILRMGNIQDGRLRLSDLKYLHLSSSDRTKYILERGDILVNRTNSAELVGKCAVFDHEGDYGYASYIIRLRVDNKLFNPRLVAHYINSPIGRTYMLTEKKQMTGQANVNTVTLRAMPIYLPARKDQDSTLDQIEQFRVLRQHLFHEQHRVLLELDAMLPAILDRTFRGELL
jgi:type I restriction enzyme S subunit